MAIDSAPRETRRYSELQGLGRAMSILEALADRPMRAKEVCDALDLKWATGYRALAFLSDHGFIRHDESTGEYSVGPRLYAIGSAYLATQPTIQSSRPLLRAAADDAGATAQLVERDRDRSIVVAVAEPASEAIPKATQGFHFPLHCGSKGHVLLAHAPPDEIDDYLERPLEALTLHSLTDPPALRERLETVRGAGYAVTDRDVQLATGSVAAPIVESDGSVRRALCLVTGANDIDRRADELVQVALSTAGSISLSVGWRPDQGSR